MSDCPEQRPAERGELQHWNSSSTGVLWILPPSRTQRTLSNMPPTASDGHASGSAKWPNWPQVFQDDQSFWEVWLHLASLFLGSCLLHPLEDPLKGMRLLQMNSEDLWLSACSTMLIYSLNSASDAGAFYLSALTQNKWFSHKGNESIAWELYTKFQVSDFQLMYKRQVWSWQAPF